MSPKTVWCACKSTWKSLPSIRQATLTTSSTLPVTLKRTVDTTVIIKDEQTIVIGGLIDDTTTGSENQVPALGDVPLLGWLFRNKSKDSVKTNLYIFITPRVIKNPEDAMRVYEGKKEHIDTIKEGSIKFNQKHPSDSINEEEKISEPSPEPKTQRRIIEPEAVREIS
jgi:general secretion pathway protein D